MFDQNYGKAALQFLQVRNKAFGILTPYSGQRFVEQQDFRLRRKRDGQFQPAVFAVA